MTIKPSYYASKSMNTLSFSQKENNIESKIKELINQIDTEINNYDDESQKYLNLLSDYLKKNKLKWSMMISRK